MNHKNKTLFETIESAPNEIVIKKNKDAALLATASGVMVVYDDNTGDYFSRYPDGTVTCSNPQRCPKDLMKAAIEYMTAKFTNDGGSNEPDGKGKVRAIDRNLNSLKNNLVVKYATSESKLAEIDCCFNEIKAILSTINEYELNKTGGSKTTGNKTEQPTDDDVPSEKVDDENAADKKPADKKPYAKKPGDKPEDEIEERAKIRKAANAVYEHYKSKIESSDVVNKAMREFKLDLAAYLAKEGMMNKIDAEIFVEKSVKFNQSVVIAEAEGEDILGYVRFISIIANKLLDLIDYTDPKVWTNDVLSRDSYTQFKDELQQLRTLQSVATADRLKEFLVKNNDSNDDFDFIAELFNSVLECFYDYPFKEAHEARTNRVMAEIMININELKDLSNAKG